MPFILALLLFLLNLSPILASETNIVGLHLTQASDINSAKEIINSSGGDWGWVTIVIRQDQLDKTLWQDFFDNCRRFHLIPIVRLSTNMDTNSWRVPELSQIDDMANFLSSLNWPTQDQHIILFNEINHASEWGGAVDVKHYADIAIYAAKKFKSLNPKYVIMGASIDLASPHKPPEFESAENVYHEIFLYRPEYFSLMDALASHSYPNHGFVGTPKDTGQHSIMGYSWELNYLKQMGITKSYPVFITETGWPHREGESPNNKFYTAKTTAEFLKEALNIWHKDPRIIAVTPFIFNYPHAPFDHFSWLSDDESLYTEYQTIVNLPKLKNHPIQIENIEPVKINLPFLIFTGHDYTGQIILKNTGQSVWGENSFCLDPQTTTNINLDSICLNNQLVFPGQTHTFDFKFKINTPSIPPNKSFISWKSLPPYEITPFAANASIYHPKDNILDRLRSYFEGISHQ